MKKLLKLVPIICVTSCALGPNVNREPQQTSDVGTSSRLEKMSSVECASNEARHTMTEVFNHHRQTLKLSPVSEADLFRNSIPVFTTGRELVEAVKQTSYAQELDKVARPFNTQMLLSTTLAWNNAKSDPNFLGMRKVSKELDVPLTEKFCLKPNSNKRVPQQTSDVGSSTLPSSKDLSFYNCNVKLLDAQTKAVLNQAMIQTKYDLPDMVMQDVNTKERSIGLGKRTWGMGSNCLGNASFKKEDKNKLFEESKNVFVDYCHVMYDGSYKNPGGARILLAYRNLKDHTIIATTPIDYIGNPQTDVLTITGNNSGQKQFGKYIVQATCADTLIK